MRASPDVGRTFGRVAEAYERTRPEYPPAAVERACAELSLTRDSTVLDLAAGTGKLTRALRSHVAHVIAVEPDAEMRAHIQGDVRAGRAEQIPLGDGEVDAVLVGDAFHWFDAAAALAEIVRVLRPGGGLAVLWNSWRQDEGLEPRLPADFKADLDAIWARFHAGPTNFPDWRDDLARSLFGPLGHARFVQRVQMSGRELVDLSLTASTPAALEEAERTAVAARAYPLMAAEYTLQIPTDVYWTALP